MISVEKKIPLNNDELRKCEKMLHKETRKYPCLIYWMTNRLDANSILHNATCCFVKTSTHLFGITAYHVIKKFHQDQQTHNNIDLCIRNAKISDWERRQIDSDEGLDIVTFEITDKEAKEIGVHPFAEGRDWISPQVGAGVFFTGYAGVDRSILNLKNIGFTQTSNASVITSVGPEEFEIQILRKDMNSLGEDHVIPPLTKDLGGFSGAPVMITSSSLSKLFHLGGIMLKQIPTDTEEGPVTFIVRRINSICQDGTIISRT